MNVLGVFGVAVALSMDAFAVATATGVSGAAASSKARARMAASFGFFQFLMPIIGWAAGVSVRGFIEDWDHWVAFGLLAFVGGNLAFGAFQDGGEKHASSDPTRGAPLLLLSIATSIDALAVGLSFAVLDLPVFLPAVVIGCVCAGFTLAGLHAGRTLRRAAIVARRAELLGGLLLICIGLEILHEHGVF